MTGQEILQRFKNKEISLEEASDLIEKLNHARKFIYNEISCYVTL